MTYKFKSALLTFAATIAALNVTPAAKADAWDKETVVTFSAPVEVPGKHLRPGTYVFKLADSDSGRHVVEIFAKDRHLITRCIAVPKVQVTAAKTAVVTFDEETTGTF